MEVSAQQNQSYENFQSIQAREKKTVGQVLEAKIKQCEEELSRLKTFQESLKGTPAYNLIEATSFF